MEILAVLAILLWLGPCLYAGIAVAVIVMNKFLSAEIRLGAYSFKSRANWLYYPIFFVLMLTLFFAFSYLTHFVFKFGKIFL